jgi:hypothetical protein
MGGILSELGDDRLGIASTFYTSVGCRPWRGDSSAFEWGDAAATSWDPARFFLREGVKILVLNDLLGLDLVRSAQNIGTERVARKILLDKGLASGFGGLEASVKEAALF